MDYMQATIVLSPSVQARCQKWINNSSFHALALPSSLPSHSLPSTYFPLFSFPTFLPMLVHPARLIQAGVLVSSANFPGGPGVNAVNNRWWQLKSMQPYFQ